MVLFVLLPFVGGWIGYHYAPEKLVEVEKIIYKDAEISNLETQTSDHQNLDYLPKEIAFVSYNESGWQSGWMVQKNKNTGKWEDVIQVAGKYINKTGVLIDEKVFLGTHGDINKNSDWSIFVTIVSLKNNEVSHIPTEGHLVNLLKVEDSVFAFIINNGMCLDSPSRIVDTNLDTCEGKIINVTPDGLSVPAFSELPGAKQLVAYDSVAKTIILSDGYGDAGCVSSNFYTYDLVSKTIIDSESYAVCADEIYGDEMSSYDSYTDDVEAFKKTVVNTYPYHIYNEESSVQSISVSSSKVKTLEKEIEHPETDCVTNLTTK